MASPKKMADAPPISPQVREVEENDADSTETTQLLGAGARDEPNGLPDISRVATWNGYEDFEGLPWWRTPSVFWLIFPYSVFTLAFGGIIVPKLNLIIDLVCQQYFADQTVLDPTHPGPKILLGQDNPECKAAGVQQAVASFMLVMNLCTGVLSTITAPKLGHLSDRYGRKKLLALASCGGLLGELVTVLAAKFPQVIDYRWLILGSIFDGLTGSFTAGGILAQAYTSDCTPPSKRSVSIGYLHACLFTGIALGPLLTGYFVEWTGSLVSIFYVVMGCHLFFIVFVAFVIPESLSKRKRLAAQEKWEKDKASRAGTPAGHWLLSGFTTFFAPLKCLVPTGPGTSSRLRLNLIALGVNDFVIMGLAMAAGQVTMLYAEYTFDWGTLETSRFISALMFVRVLVLMGIFPIINYIFRVRPARRRSLASGVPMVDKNSGADTLDVWILRISLLSDMLGCLGYFLARSPVLFFGGGMLTAFGGLGSATVQAVVTKHVPSERVGQMLGAIGMVHALARVIGPVIFNGLYAETVANFPQAVFLLLICLFGVALVFTLAIKPHVHWEEEVEETPEPANAAAQAFHSDNQRVPVDEDQVLIQT